MERTIDELKQIYSTLDDNEKFGLSFGLFPIRLMDLKLTNHESADLIGISQKISGVEM